MTWGVCTTIESGSKISLSDKNSKRKAIFINSEKRKLKKTQWDACVICNATAADWVLTCEQEGQVIVELKGADADHACQQILQSAADLKKINQLGAKVGGLVLCTQYPKFDTKVRRAKQEFYKKYKGPLHVVSSRGDFHISKVLSMSGPR